MVLEYIIAATMLVSFASLSGIVMLNLKEKRAQQLLFFFVSFSAGTLLGAALLDLLPEAAQGKELAQVMPLVLLGILVFFVLEKIIHWHHHHSMHRKSDMEKAKPKPLGYLNLIGDGIHNFVDGAAIAAAFMAGIPTGFAITIAVLLHEIPQEIGDYSLLIYAGFERQKALLLNLISAIAALVGALAFYFAAPFIENLNSIALAFTAGMFLYIASTDLVPEMHKETDPQKSGLQLLFIILGIGLIWMVVTYIEG